jgi:hypothetical protein
MRKEQITMMADQNSDARADQHPSQPNPALQPLAVFVGEWTMAISSPAYPSTMVGGHASFEWIEGGAFLMMHTDVEPGGPPSGIAVIGRDDAAETYSMLYFDARGVSRIYEMSLEGSVWRLHREAPGFSQRFTAAFSDDGTTITGHWEKSTDGSHWELDLNWSYTRTG